MKKMLKSIQFNYLTRSFATAYFSFGLSVLFLIYNLIVGIIYNSIWHISIFPYYLILVILRVIVFIFERKLKQQSKEEILLKSQKMYLIIGVLLLIMNFLLIAPISLMVIFARKIHFDTISAIAIATYTTYKITMAVIGFVKSKKYENKSIYGLKMINLMDALVSILTLQNTLIMVFNEGKSMLTFTAFTSGVILLLMVVINILFIKKTRK